MAGIVAKHRYQIKFSNSHLTLNIFNLYLPRFFFGLVYACVRMSNNMKLKQRKTMPATMHKLSRQACLRFFIVSQ